MSVDTKPSINSQSKVGVTFDSPFGIFHKKPQQQRQKSRGGQTDRMFTLAVVFLLSSVPVRSEPLLPSIAANLNKVLFVYPKDIQSERDLFVCPDNSACNIIYKRFWLPPVVERLCRCPQRHECDWTWSADPDNYTVTLDNRSQMKFCIDLSELPQCGLKKPGIRTSVQLSNPQANATLTLKPLNSQKTNRHTEIKNVTAFCNCPDPHYWKLKPNSTKHEEDTDRIHQTYICSKLKKCSEMEFCGYVRTDTYSTIYRCSCPKGHMCISKDKTTFKVEEMLFNGHAYKAQCFPVKDKRRLT